VTITNFDWWFTVYSDRFFGVKMTGETGDFKFDISVGGIKLVGNK